MKTYNGLFSVCSLLIALAPSACSDDDGGPGGNGGTGGSGGATSSSGVGGTGAQGGGGEMNMAPAPPTAFTLALNTSPYGVDMTWQAPADSDLAGYIVARSNVPFDAANTPVDGQPYNVGDLLPGGASVVFAANQTAASDPNAPLEATSYYAVFAVDTAGLYSDPATDSITIGFPQQNGTIEISNIVNSPTVSITQQTANIQLEGSATYNSATTTLTLSLTITNLSNRVLYSPKVAIDTTNAGAVLSDGTTVDGRISAYYGPEGLGVGSQKTRDFVITGFGATDPVVLNIEVLNNPMGFASAAYNKGSVNFFDLSGAVTNGGVAFGGQAHFQLGWKPALALDGSFTEGVFGPDGVYHYAGWKSRPVVAQIDMTTLQAVTSVDLSNDSSNYGFTSNVLISPDENSLYTLVTTGAHRYSGGPNYQNSSDVDLVRLDRATLVEQARIPLLTGVPIQSNGRPARGNRLGMSGDGSVMVAAVEPGQLWIVDTATFTLIDADSNQSGVQPVDVSGVSDSVRIAAVNADGTTAYVGYHDGGPNGEDLITVVDLSAFTTSTITSTAIAGAHAPGWSALTFGPDNLLYIARNFTLTAGDVPLATFNTSTSTHTDIAVTIQVMGLLFDPAGTRYYVLQRNAGGLNNNGEVLTYNLADHTLIDIDGDSANGQTNLPTASVSTNAAHNHGITPF